uniref:VQ domain-containing protein n=1 Tax=Leersia perrieri TaxID=77586 RepID=A0A0D9XWJ0_9ORYZ
MPIHMLDSSSSSPSPWHGQGLPPHRHHLLIPYPSPPPPAPPPPHHLRAAGRRIAKRRPRPSRRLPTTHISADPANFRRMVHQVTGADDLLPPLPPSHSSPQAPELLRQLPATSAGCSAPLNLMLPTLDTSAFLLGFKVRAVAAVAPPSDGSPALVGGGGSANFSNNNSSSSSSGGNCGAGFPTLDSWDLL